MSQFHDSEDQPIRPIDRTYTPPPIDAQIKRAAEAADEILGDSPLASDKNASKVWLPSRPGNHIAGNRIDSANSKLHPSSREKRGAKNLYVRVNGRVRPYNPIVDDVNDAFEA